MKFSACRWLGWAATSFLLPYYLGLCHKFLE
jgi:hypothetical protein